jgi:hypothetical protein
MKTNLIKRDVLEQMNKSKLRRYCTISAILYLVTLIFSFIISWTPLYSFSNFLFALCGTFICYYLLKEKVNLNNTCPKCNDNNFYPKIETKKTTVSISTSKSIYERGANGKYIGFCDDDDIWFPSKIELQINEHFSSLNENFSFHFKHFQSEYDMLYTFLHNFVRKFPMMTGWNFIKFDWQYIVNRAKKLKI